jgi:GNAT superfamily N-acetyltransferase
MILAGVIEYRLRPVDGRDSLALYELHRDTMRIYIEEVFGGWDEAVQLAFHEQWMNRQRAQVIEVDGRLVRVVDTEWRDGELYLARIEVSPALQNLGLGDAIITGLIQLAARRSLPVGLDVFEVNPARHLYERLGFTPPSSAERDIGAAGASAQACAGDAEVDGLMCARRS